jgi:hypothetical protein
MKIRVLAGCLAAIVSAPLILDATSGPGSGHGRRRAELLADGLQGATGSTIGPDGALYVTEGAIGQITRIHPTSGAMTVFASGLPAAIIGIGGAIDVEFIGKKAYALVTLVADDVGGNSDVGIYRVNGPNHKVVANIGRFAIDHPPTGFEFQVATGLQYAMEAYRDGFLVTDGHHNRLLQVALDGRVRVANAFDNIVPTGLELLGDIVLMGQAGPTPHRPEDGKIVGLLPNLPFVHTVATGAPLLVDVEFGHGGRLYALSQGVFGGGDPGAPALPNTGALMRVDGHGGFEVVVEGLNLPTSVEFIGDTAYVVSLAGSVWRIDNVSRVRIAG